MPEQKMIKTRDDHLGQELGRMLGQKVGPKKLVSSALVTKLSQGLRHELITTVRN